MAMHRTLWRPRAINLLRFGWLVCTIAGFCVSVRAESIDSLAQAKRVYVSAFTGGQEAEHLRESFVRHLDGGRFQVVQSSQEADAILHGVGEVWLKGYVSFNGRTPSSDRHAVYTGSLAIEVTGRDGEPIWSWLTTPGRLSWSNIVDNLAGRAAKKLNEAAGASATAGPASASAVSSLAPADLTAGGATFPAPLYQKWSQDFAASHPGVRFRYSPIGSEAGVRRLVAGDIDFAGSDVAPEAVVGASAAHLRRIPSVVGAVVPIYNLNGVTQDLRFTPEVLADIYLGRVKRWDDESLRRWNRGINLPAMPITVVHRTDGSGTSWVWSDFLAKASPEWLSAVGRGTTLRWPVGQEAIGNDGVAEAVLNTPNSIGYVELTYAIQHRLSFGSVRNKAGEFVRADLDSVSEAAKGVVLSADGAPTITDANSKYAYPISSFTWLVAPTVLANDAKGEAVRALLEWVLVYGQRDCSALGYAPLPREVVDEQLRLLKSAH